MDSTQDNDMPKQCDKMSAQLHALQFSQQVELVRLEIILAHLETTLHELQRLSSRQSEA